MPAYEVMQARWAVSDQVQTRVLGKEQGLDLSYPWQELRQVHGTRVLCLDSEPDSGTLPEADALYTRLENVVCAIRTADCLPVFLASADGSEVALAHAGWRRLAAGVLENSPACFRAPRSAIHAWFGPAIGPCHFEVGEDVFQAFLQAAPSSCRQSTARAFEPGRQAGKWQADLYALAGIRLQAAGLDAAHISGGGLCTYCDAENFHSYRRDGEQGGRIMSLIWRQPISR